MFDYYELRFENVKNITEFIDNKHALITEIAEDNSVIKEYVASIVEVDLEDKEVVVVVTYDIAAHTPFKRIVKPVISK